MIADCHGRGVIPVLVGGSALYIRAILDEFEFPGTDPVVRARLEGELAEVGAEAMYARLVEVDPAAAVRMLPQNGRRVVRALEVIELTGEPWTPSLPDPQLPLRRRRAGRRGHRPGDARPADRGTGGADVGRRVRRGGAGAGGGRAA